MARATDKEYYLVCPQAEISQDPRKTGGSVVGAGHFIAGGLAIWQNGLILCKVPEGIKKP